MIPHSHEAEISVLGSIMLDNAVYEEVEGWLRKDVFFKTGHKLIWKVIKQLIKDKTIADLVTVVNALKETDKLEDAGGSIYLFEITSGIPSTANAGAYAKIIYSKYVQRKVAETSAEMQKVALEGSYQDTSAILVKHQKYIEELANLQPTRKVDIVDVVDDAIDHILTSDNLIPFGVPALDDAASGGTRGEITAVGGRPGHGKTTLITNITHNLTAPSRKLKVMVFNREMRNPAMIEKLLVINQHFRSKALRKKQFTEKDILKLEDTREMMKKRYANLIMYDDIRDLDETMREIKRHKPDVIIDDYIQLIKVAGITERRFQIEEIMNEYKWIAKSTNCHVVLVSQLSRGIESRVDPMPRGSDFAEGGTIEQVAESAMFVFRGYIFDHEEATKYEANLIVAKSRYGEPATYDVGFNGDKCMFYKTALEAEAQDG